jgi:geranylgeranyl diphosphate synthase type I
MGALLAGASGRTVGKLRSAGRLLGQTFQMRDDWLGTFGDPERTGKGREGDLARRKLTFPVISAYSRASYAEQRDLCTLFSESDTENGETRIRTILAGLGEPAASAATITQTANAAVAAVAGSGLDPAWVADFSAITEFVAHRMR